MPKLVRLEYGSLPLYEHWCPGCENIHQIAVEVPFSNGAKWTFNGDFNKPTFNPSINVNPSMPKMQCHYFLHDGQIKYCEDSHHALKGKTVELPLIPDDWY